MNEPRTDVWVLDNEVRFTDGCKEPQLPTSEYPLQFWLVCADFRDGDGWGRSTVEEHVTVVEDFLYDAKHSAELYGVLVEAKDEAAVVALSKAGHDPYDLVPTQL